MNCVVRSNRTLIPPQTGQSFQPNLITLERSGERCEFAGVYGHPVAARRGHFSMTFLVLSGVLLTCFFCLGKAFFESVICGVIHSRLAAPLSLAGKSVAGVLVWRYLRSTDDASVGETRDS